MKTNKQINNQTNTAWGIGYQNKIFNIDLHRATMENTTWVILSISLKAMSRRDSLLFIGWEWKSELHTIYKCFIVELYIQNSCLN